MTCARELAPVHGGALRSQAARQGPSLGSGRCMAITVALGRGRCGSALSGRRRRFFNGQSVCASPPCDGERALQPVIGVL
jgi:hypothetical protein